MFRKDIIPNKKKKEDLNDNLLMFIKIGGTFIIIIFLLYLFRFGYQGFSNDQEVWAQFGDYFGGILNPIFAFLAFIALLITIKLQNEALQTSKDELKASREELEKSRKAQQEQSVSLKLQNKATELQIFENTFFQLNSLVNNIKKSLVINIETNIDNGRIIINKVSISLSSYRLRNTLSEFKDGKYEGKEVILNLLKLYKMTWFNSNAYDRFNVKFENITGAYFSSIYQILKFIDESSIENKQRYVNIFRAQFSKEELEFIFYHCLGKIGRKKFKGLIEKYEFFEHITHIEKKNEISKPLSEYEISAYGKNESLRKMHEDYKDKYWDKNFDE